MMTPKVTSAILTDHGVSVMFNNGEHHSVERDHSNFDKIVTRLRENDFSNIYDLMDEKRHIEQLGLGQITIQDGVIYHGDEPLPDDVLAVWLHQFKSAGANLTPLLNYADRLMKNPDYHIVRGQLTRFLEAHFYAIHEDGRIIMPKGVTEDFKDQHSRSVDYSPGNVVEMKRYNVEKDPQKPCAPGLHVGSFTYAQMWSAKQVMCAVDPADVVSVPADGGGVDKIRTCRLEVLREAPELEPEKRKAQTSPVERANHGPGEYTFEVVALTHEGDFHSTTVTTYGDSRFIAEAEAAECVGYDQKIDMDTVKIRQLLYYEEPDDPEENSIIIDLVALTYEGSVVETSVGSNSSSWKQDDELIMDLQEDYDLYAIMMDKAPSGEVVDLGTLKVKEVHEIDD